MSASIVSDLEARNEAAVEASFAARRDGSRSPFALLTAAAIWVVQRFRRRQIEAATAARLAERMRVARDLHDTLLQTIEGSKLVVDVALRAVDDAAAMRRALEQVSAWLDRATGEGRAVLGSLRTSPLDDNDLVAALQRVSERTAVPRAMTVTWAVGGTPREIHPVVGDEVYRIGAEAIANAAQHSGARRLRVELEYAQDLIVRVIDDGRGIDARIADSGRPGHLGLPGMRERAAGIAAKLVISGAANAGTTVALAVPGGLAFSRPRVLRSARIRAWIG